LSFSQSSFAAAEGSGKAAIKVVRSGNTAMLVTVRYATSNGTALATKDYTTTAGTLVFTPGATSRTFAVPILKDALVEGTEVVNLALSSPSTGARVIPPSAARLNIVDDDAKAVYFSVVRAIADEGDANTTLNLVVQRSGSFAQSASVTVKTVAETGVGKATAGQDYKAVNTVATFAPGVGRKIVPVTILGDLSVEGNETFKVQLSAPAGAALGTQRTVTVVIRDHE